MNVDYFKTAKVWALVLLFLFVGGTNARADFQVTDDITVSGFLRQTLVLNMGTGNPFLMDTSRFPFARQSDKNRLNLMRSHFQVEVNYRPTEIFRLFMKMRAIHDQTQLLDHDLNDYDAFPWGERHGWDFISGHGEDHFQADIWEFWVNIETDLFWARIGKQQIAWGDLPGIRIADKVNPLDLSWHLALEPEEYENVRIPEWAARVYYTLPEVVTGPFAEIYIDAYINPGDVKPDMQPAPGSPYDNGWKSYTTGNEIYEDNRGETEWGARMGFNIGQLQASFNYLSIHYHTPIWDWTGPPGPPNPAHFAAIKFPEIDMYAVTASYAIPWPIGVVMTFEGSYTPDHPWQGVTPAQYPPTEGEADFYRGALYMERDMFFLNSLTRFFYPGKLGFMYYRHHVSDGDTVKLNWAPYCDGRNRLDWDMDLLYLSYTQGFGPGKSWEINPKCYWHPEGAYKIQCFLKYQPNYDWRFDLGVMWQGGSSIAHPMLPTYNFWQDEAYFRITYSF